MSHLGSDSEIEEIHPQPTPRPRPVRRPVPVRAKSSSASGLGSSEAVAIFDDSDDDEDFFRRRRPAVALHTNEKAAERVELLHTTESHAAKEAPAVEAVPDLGGSDSERGGMLVTESREKRKHSQSRSESESEPEARQVRSRSVSLTPPPSLEPQGRTNDSPDDRGYQHSRNEPDDVYILDSDSEPSVQPVRSSARRLDSDISSLDPALQAVFRSGETSSSRAGSATAMGAGNLDYVRSPGSFRSSPQPDPAAAATMSRARPSGVLEKVQVEFQFMYDDDFLNYELPAFWEAKRWRRVKIHERNKVIKKLSERIAIIVFTSDTMDKALWAYAGAFAVDVLATDPVLLNRTMRVFPTSTLASLGDKLAHYITAVPRSVYNRMREKEALEQAQLAREREQAQRDFEMVRELQRSTAAAGALDEESNGQQSVEDDGQDAAPAGGDTSGGAGPGTRIKIRDKSGKDVLLRVAATTSIRAVIENYRKLSGLDSGARVTLEFDDEALDPNATIGDTEIEDDDMLTAFCQ